MEKSELPFSSDTVLVDMAHPFELTADGLAALRQRWGAAAKFSQLWNERDIEPARLRAPEGLSAGSFMIVVDCSGQPGDLSVLVFSRGEDMMAFAEANQFTKGLVTRRGRHFLFWFRTDYAAAQNIETEHVSFIVKGKVPVGLLDPTTRLPEVDVAVDGHPPVMSFGQIVWPENLEPAFRHARLQHMFGPPFLPARRGSSTLNVIYWGHRLGANGDSTYDTDRQTFFAKSPEGELVPVASDMAERYVMIALHQFARAAGAAFPIGDIRLSRVRAIIEVMKLAVTRHQPTSRDGLREFVDHHLVKQLGASVTSHELRVGYQAFCQASQLPAEPEAAFLRSIPHLIRTQHGVGKSNSLQRDGRAQRGFRNLALVEAQPPPAGTARTPGTPDKNSVATP